jgi:hypothetical protein
LYQKNTWNYDQPEGRYYRKDWGYNLKKNWSEVERRIVFDVYDAVVELMYDVERHWDGEERSKDAPDQDLLYIAIFL